MAMITTIRKSERFSIRLSAIEVSMLNDLADAAGESAAVVVRGLIRREHAKLEPQPKRPSKARKA
jgi:hypothetical protein